MKFINKIEITGIIGSSNFFQTEAGAALKLSVATRHDVLSSTGKTYEITTWHNVTIFGDDAVAFKDKAVKGVWVKVKGLLSKRKYQGKYYDQINPDKVEVLAA